MYVRGGRQGKRERVSSNRTRNRKRSADEEVTSGARMKHRAILQEIAQRSMLEHGLLPEFSAPALAELAKIHAAPTAGAEGVRDLREPAVVFHRQRRFA